MPLEGPGLSEPTQAEWADAVQRQGYAGIEQATSTTTPAWLARHGG